MFVCACVCVGVCGLDVTEETISFSVVHQLNLGLDRLFSGFYIKHTQGMTSLDG